MGVNINGENLNHLRFADDILLISENRDDLLYMLQSLDTESLKCGLQMNPDKTSILTNGPVLPTRIRGHTIEYVDEYIYLGQRISFRNQSTSEVDRRIKIAWGRYWSLKHIFKTKLPPKVKKKAMDTTVLPTLLYGCQNWALSKKIINKLQVFQRAMERSMIDIRLRDRVKN